MDTAPSRPQVHSMAKSGFGAGTNELYDRARPSYQSAVLSHLKQAVRSKASVDIVEIGSGTGIFTRALLAHPEWQSTVHELKAVEPSEGMRDTFAKSVSDPRVSVSDGTFDHTGVENGWADLVVIAQAFHWCPDHEAAVTEFARVLKPDGIVALIWNMEDREGAAWVAQLRDLYEVYEQGTPQFRLGLWRNAFAVPSYEKSFQPPEETVFSFHLPGTLEIATDRVCSKSYIAVLPENEKNGVKEDVKKIVERGDGKTWIDEKAGVFQYPYKTTVVVMRRK